MGKGDKKTRRGKISADSYGKYRPRKKKKVGEQNNENSTPKSEE